MPPSGAAHIDVIKGIGPGLLHALEFVENYAIAYGFFATVAPAFSIGVRYPDKRPHADR